MLQFYFLSVLLNLIAGLIFIYASDGANSAGKTSLVLSDGDDPFAEHASAPAADFDPEIDDFDLNLDSHSDSGDPFAEGGAEGKQPETGSAGGFKALAASFFGDKTLQLVGGILSALTALMKLLSPIQYDIAIVGDLVPALAGFAAAAVLLLDWYQERSDVSLSLPESIENIYTGGRTYLGSFCIIAAVLHFIFPRVLFL